MNPEKLKQLQLKASTQIGGKGTPRRKTKPVHHSSAVEEKKIQLALKKVGAQPAGTFEEVIFLQDGGNVLLFNKANVQVAQQSNMFVVSGTPQQKTFMDILPSVLGGLGPESLSQLSGIMAAQGGNAAATATSADDEEAPELVQNFDEAAKTE